MNGRVRASVLGLAVRALWHLSNSGGFVKLSAFSAFTRSSDINFRGHWPHSLSSGTPRTLMSLYLFSYASNVCFNPLFSFARSSMEVSRVMIRSLWSESAPSASVTRTSNESTWCLTASSVVWISKGLFLVLLWCYSGISGVQLPTWLSVSCCCCSATAAAAASVLLVAGLLFLLPSDISNINLTLEGRWCKITFTL